MTHLPPLLSAPVPAVQAAADAVRRLWLASEDPEHQAEAVLLAVRLAGIQGEVAVLVERVRGEGRRL